MKAAALRSRSGSRLEPRPMARAVKIPLVEREVRERLGGAAVGLLLCRAEVLSEGRRSDSPTAGRAFFGTTMITIHLDRLADVVRDPIVPETAANLAHLMSEDRRLIDRVRKLAHAEARRLDDSALRVRTDVQFRVEGTTIHVDVEMESDAE